MSMGNGGERAAGLEMQFSIEIMKPLAESAASILTVMHVVGIMDAMAAVAEAMKKQGQRVDPGILEHAQQQALDMLWAITEKIEEARQAVRAI